jgi:hypothetical protein
MPKEKLINSLRLAPGASRAGISKNLAVVRPDGHDVDCMR